MAELPDDKQVLDLCEITDDDEFIAEVYKTMLNCTAAWAYRFGVKPHEAAIRIGLSVALETAMKEAMTGGWDAVSMSIADMLATRAHGEAS